MATPESAVKRKISRTLKLRGPELFYAMEVPSGFGKSGLDYWGVYKGKPFAIEAKAPGGEPTDRQRATIARMQVAGIEVFVIDGDLTELIQWLNQQ